jgi:hypothetical protein
LWTLATAFKFLIVKRNDLNIPRCYLYQLSLFEKRLKEAGNVLKCYNDFKAKCKEELCMMNTNLNTLPKEYIKRKEVNRNENKSNVKFDKFKGENKTNQRKMHTTKEEYQKKPIKSILKREQSDRSIPGINITQYENNLHTDQEEKIINDVKSEAINKNLLFNTYSHKKKEDIPCMTKPTSIIKSYMYYSLI